MKTEWKNFTPQYSEALVDLGEDTIIKKFNNRFNRQIKKKKFIINTGS
ncbi:hypothetical protein XF24_00036 [candidate division SR1 bacterium Aalborg_AAW-1]|nr:hypothetical protein XF24_00036 [candidate division SR1 bacterium Aalborg_AAW-1]